jgi:hypothetical protein
MVRGTWSPEYPWAPTEDEWRQRLAEIRDGWGRRAFFVRLLNEWAPDAPEDDEFVDWFTTHLRRSLSPGAAVALFRTTMESDVSGVLAAVRVPTLVVHRETEREPAEYFAERVAGCRLVTLPGLRGVYTWLNDATHELVMRSSSQLIAGLGRERERERILATIPSRTSSARRRRPPTWAMRGGASCSTATMPSYAGSSRGTEARSSTRQVTASSPRSTARVERSHARARSATGYGTSASRYELVSTRASASASTASWVASRSPSEHVSLRGGAGDVLVTGRCAIS